MRFPFDLYFGTAVAYRHCRGSVYVRNHVHFGQPLLVPASRSARTRNRSPLRSTFSDYRRARLLGSATRNRHRQNHAGTSGRNCRVGEGHGEQAHDRRVRSPAPIGRIQEADPDDLSHADEPAREPGSLREPSHYESPESRIAGCLAHFRPQLAMGRLWVLVPIT